MWRSFDTHIRHILDKRKPKTLLEIGVLRGDNTLKLLEWCSTNDAHLTSLDPVPWEGDLPEEVKEPMLGYKYKRGQQGFENWTIEATALEDVFRLGLDRHWTCVKTRSLEYLASPHFDGFDVYLVDGDHNYYTVSKELELIYTYCKVGDIVLFNDVVGEWSRHDQYYDPEFIPAEYVGGRKQGVLTAIEDFVNSFNERRPWWRKNRPYRFRILTKKHDGLGALTRVS